MVGKSLGNLWVRTFKNIILIFVGYIPLYAAVLKNDTNAVEYLLKYNASTNIQSNEGKNLILFLCKNKMTIFC